jgi:hypothetical protein
MAKEKTRLSKKAKAALKTLEESKLLAASKTVTDSKADQKLKPSDSSVKTSAPNKLRPEKKRG